MKRAKRIFQYQQDGRTLYRIDMYVRTFNGAKTRYREWGFQTIVDAQRAVDLKLSERFVPPSEQRGQVTVREAWRLYDEGARARGCPSSKGRFKHIDDHIGGVLLSDLHLGMIDAYRTKRRKEQQLIRKRAPSTGEIDILPRLRRGDTKPCFPSDCSLDHELKLLRAVLNHAVKCKRIAANPIAGMRLLNPDNARTSVVSETDFGRLLAAADDWLRPILIVAYDTGMRQGEILNLRWDQVDLDGRKIFLRADDTKANQARIVYLTDRAHTALNSIHRGPRRLVFGADGSRRARGCGFRNGFARAKESAGLSRIWFHDLRRSFVTNARKRGVPESVVMKMSGHRTRNVFARYNIIDDSDLREAIKRIELGQSGA